MRSTITAACCLAIIAVAGFADKPPKETPPTPQTLTTLETDVITPAKTYTCDNPDCACEDCQCDPCECGTVKKSLTVDTRPIIYFFTADWCGPCQQMKPIAGQLHAEGHTCYSVDFDTRQDLVSKYGVTSVPQFVVVDGAKVIRRVIGTTTKERVLGTEPVNSPLPASAASQGYKPILYQPSYRVQPPQRTGLFRGRMTRSVCGPGGCR